MEVDPSVNACIYDPELFIEEDGSMKYQDDRYEVLHGVDVSEHQGYIDWEAVARAGYSFAFIRVGYRGYGEAGISGVPKLPVSGSVPISSPRH